MIHDVDVYCLRRSFRRTQLNPGWHLLRLFLSFSFFFQPDGMTLSLPSFKICADVCLPCPMSGKVLLLRSLRRRLEISLQNPHNRFTGNIKMIRQLLCRPFFGKLISKLDKRTIEKRQSIQTLLFNLMLRPVMRVMSLCTRKIPVS